MHEEPSPNTPNMPNTPHMPNASGGSGAPRAPRGTGASSAPQASAASGQRNNPRNNPRQHKKPTRRAAGAAPTQNLAGAGAAQAHVREQQASEVDARAAYEEYAAATERPHPGSVNRAHRGGQQRSSAYGGYAQSVGGHARVNPAQKAAGQAAPYADYTRYTQKPKKKTSIVSIIVAVVILGALGAGAYLYLNPPTFNIAINGMTRTVDNGTTLADIVAEGVVKPQPGNLVAVDGEVLEEGKGVAFTATINGEEVTDPSTALHKNDTVQIDDGTDVMEEYDVKVVEKKPKKVELGQGAIHAIISGEAGTVEKRTGKISGKTAKEVTKAVVNDTYFMYNANPGDDKVIALTFDDGPWGTTPELLDVLKENDVVATFFTIGNQISTYEDTAKRTMKEGHQLCTHSWSHASGSGNGVDLTLMSPEEQVEEVTKGQQAVVDITGGEAPRAFRAPGGNFHGDLIWNVAPYVDYEIGWNVDTEDWRMPGAQTIADRILSAKSGDIVLMHDGGGDRSQTIEALRTALPQLKEKGYKFVTIDQLLAYDDPKALAEEAQKKADEEKSE